MKKQDITRREFLKRIGLGAGVAGLALSGCESASRKMTEKSQATKEIPKDKMTYRTNPKTGEKVSILGYGCMRWPTVSGESARDGADEIDQEAVN